MVVDFVFLNIIIIILARRGKTTKLYRESPAFQHREREDITKPTAVVKTHKMFQTKIYIVKSKEYHQ